MNELDSKEDELDSSKEITAETTNQFVSQDKTFNTEDIKAIHEVRMADLNDIANEIHKKFDGDKKKSFDSHSQKSTI